MGTENIGFVIPINLAESFLSSLFEHIRVIRYYVAFNDQFKFQEFQKVPDQFFSCVISLQAEMVESGSRAETATFGGKNQYNH